jgi:hypothetical protein
VKLSAVWEFIAGDSRLAPLAVALGIVISIVLLRASVPSGVVAMTFPCIIALGLAASIFERR